MALSLLTNWQAGDVLYAADLRGEFNNLYNNPISLISPVTANIDIDGFDVVDIDELELRNAAADATAVRRLRANAANLTWHDGTAAGRMFYAGGTDVPLADGGTGASLTDPNADRILFWDDSVGAITFLTAGAGLTLSGTTLATTAVTTQTRSIIIGATEMTASQGSPTLSEIVAGTRGARWRLDAATQEGINAMAVVPPDWDSGGFTLVLHWANEGAGSGNVVWGTQYYEVAVGSATRTTLQSLEGPAQTAGAADVLTQLTRAAGTAPGGTGRVIEISIYRAAADAGDTLAQDAGVYAVELRYTSAS